MDAGEGGERRRQRHEAVVATARVADRQRFQRRLGETRGAILHADQRADPRRVSGLGDELPRASHTHEAIAATEAFDFAGQNFQRGGDAFGFCAGVLLAIGFLASLAQNVL